MTKNTFAVVSNPTSSAPSFQTVPSESDIREYAFCLFEQSGGSHGHDKFHWFEARARLLARIPKDYSCGPIHHSPTFGSPDAFGRERAAQSAAPVSGVRASMSKRA